MVEKDKAEARRLQDNEPNPDIALLKDAKIETDAGKLVAWLESHSDCDDDLLSLNKLIAQLGARDFETREAASTKLVNVGAPSLEVLIAARNGKDVDTSRRAKECINTITKNLDQGIALSVVRTLLRVRSTKTASTLLRYLPYAVDEVTEEEIWVGLFDLESATTALDKCVVEALNDPLPQRRAIAGFLVARLGNDAQRTAARKLLNDTDPWVRLRTAQGLLASGNKDAVPVLIALLLEPDPRVSWQAAELLEFTITPDATAVLQNALSTDPADWHGRWSAWWKENKADLDLVSRLKSRPFPPRLLLLYSTQQRPKEASVDTRVILCGSGGLSFWHVTVPAEDVVIGRFRADCFTCVESSMAATHEGLVRLAERDLRGKVVREKEFPAAVWSDCRYLPNGNTLLLPQRVEFGLTGESRRWKGARVPLLSTDRLLRIHRSDEAGETQLRRTSEAHPSEALRMSVPYPSESIQDFALLPSNDVIAVVEENNDRNRYRNLIVVFDPVGKLAFRCSVPSSRFVELLYKHNMLLRASQRMMEVTPEGKTVWELYHHDPLIRVHTCFRLLSLGFVTDTEEATDLDSVGALIGKLQNRNMLVRRAAALGVSICKNKTTLSPYLPELIKALGDQDEFVQAKCAQALLNAEDNPVRTLEKLVFSDRPINYRIQKRALQTLIMCRQPADESALQAMVKAIDHNEPSLRVQASRLILDFRPLDEASKKKVIDALISRTGDRQQDENGHKVCYEILASIAAFGEEAKDAKDSLIKASADMDERVRAMAILALARTNPLDPEVRSLVEAVVDDKRAPPLVRSYAIKGLRSGRLKSAKAVASLFAALKEPDVRMADGTSMHEVILDVLPNLELNAHDAGAGLLAVINDDHEAKTVRLRAITALHRVSLDPDDIGRILETLSLVLQSEDGDLKSAARTSIGEIKRKYGKEPR
jgi:HEAT repeat protein